MPTAQPVSIKSPLGDDLLFSSLEASDEMSRPYALEVGLLSPKEDLAFDDLLGLDATIELELPIGGTRYFHGLISEFAQTGRRGDYVSYSMVLRPHLWFLSRTADCRIFQNKTAPEIIKEVFDEHGLEYEDALTSGYRTWEYLVQYRETDFNFLCRVMEQEGIYFFFLHEDGKHTLVLADGYGAHKLLPDYETIPYFPPSENVVREEHIFDWSMRRAVQTGNYVQRAFDFRKPRANLETNATIPRQHAQADYEIFDYPGEYFERSEGDVYAHTRIEEMQSRFELLHGLTDVRGVFAGGLFTLEEYPREDQNREYLVVGCQHSITMVDYESGGDDMKFESSLQVIESQTPFRALRITPKPVVQGPQTAIVVGPAGEEIHTDEYGRVKVQFHWDRYGKKDENSSCWVRVAQIWAGTNWGGMFIPRIGQEVIVDFVEGDPDRPLITGRVYNADNMPPYDLPADKTKSTVKSRSSKSGTPDNFNEFRFEDKKGEEEMYLHAEKDQTIVVENDKNESVGHDNTESIGNDEKIDVGNNRDKTVGVDQSETIGNDKSISVGSNHTESIGVNKTIQVGSNHNESIGANMSQNVGANKAESIAVGKALTIGAGYQVTVGASKNQTIGATKSEQVGADSSEAVGSDKSVSAGKKMSLTSGDDFAISGDKNGVITIKDKLTIKVGSASITMSKNGDIVIKGAKINVKGSKDIVIKGKKILEN